jgi:flagellar biosynthesis/type III secretory pathway chaperone
MQLLELVADRRGPARGAPEPAGAGELPARRRWARRLDQQREQLTEVLRELADVNKANALLVRAHLDYVQHLASVLSQAGDGTTSLLVDRWT